MPEVNRSSTPIVVVVAIIGLLSTVGASALGGYWASRSAKTAAESVKLQFESQRKAEVEDLRRDVYKDFLRVATEACLAYQGNDDAKFDSAAVEVVNQLGLVIFLAEPELEDVASQFTNAIIDESACSDNDILFGQVNAFIDTAQKDLE